MKKIKKCIAKIVVMSLIITMLYGLDFTKYIKAESLTEANWSFFQSGHCTDFSSEGDEGYINSVTMAGTDEKILDWPRSVVTAEAEALKTATHSSNGFTMDIENTGFDCQWKEITGYETNRINPWSVQATANTEIIAGHEYTVTFKAKASKKKYAYIDFGCEIENIAPYYEAGLIEGSDENLIVIDTQEKTFTYSFVNWVSAEQLNTTFMLGAFDAQYDSEGNDVSHIITEVENGWKGEVVISDFNVIDKGTHICSCVTMPTTESKETTTIASDKTTSAVCDETSNKETLSQIKLKRPSIKLTAGKKKITVKYNKIAKAKKYQVKIKIGKKWKKFTTTKTRYVVKRLKSGTKYTVKVRAVATNGKKTVYSKYSKTKKVKTKGTILSKSKKKKVALNKTSYQLTVGKTVKLKLKNSKAKNVKWSSNNKKVAKVSKNGLVKALKKGKATITAKYKGKKYKCKIRVVKSNLENMPQVIPGDNTTEESFDNIYEGSIKQSEHIIEELYDGNNIIFSPMSLNMVLGMSVNGATEPVKSDLLTYLNGKSVEDTNAKAKDLMEKDKTDDFVKIANSFWHITGSEINPLFKTAIETNYLASINEAPMDQTTVDEINGWADENTDGMVKKILKEIPINTVSILSNAILFDAEWTSPFIANYTYKTNFTKFNNEQVQVDMMQGNEHIYFENDYAIGFEKTYGKKREYSFIAILPKKTGEFNISELDIDGFLKTKTDKYIVEIEMPKFSYSWNSSLKTPLLQTNIGGIFDYNLMPFNNTFLNINESVHATDIVQSCKIIVDEEGTKAAAVTNMYDGVTSVSPEYKRYVDLDRPFAYVIVDNVADEVLFMGKLVDPTQE